MPGWVVDKGQEVQVLVSAVNGGSLPNTATVLQYFQLTCSSDASVEDIDEGYLVTLRHHVTARRLWLRVGELLISSQKENLIVDGHLIQVDLLVPDVYGCEVTVTAGCVEVNVGHDVINNIAQDRKWVAILCRKVLHGFDHCFFLHDTLSVHYMNTGQLAVTFDPSNRPSSRWILEVFILNMLKEQLSFYKEDLQTSPLPVRDRCIDKCQSRSAQGLSPGTDVCRAHADAWIKLSSEKYIMVKRDVFLKKMCTTYPGLTCSRKWSTLKLSGENYVVKKATKHALDYVRSLSKETIPLTDTEAMMMKQTEAQNWLQQSLDSEDVDCVWKPLNAENVSRLFRGQSILAIATDSNLKAFKRIMKSCFKTAVVSLPSPQAHPLQSNQWKQFLEDLQKPSENGIAAVLKVGGDAITICDTASNIDTTRGAVLDFFGRSNRTQLEPHRKFCGQVTEVIIDLQPWQIKLVQTAKNKKQLPGCLHQTVSVHSDMKSVSIRDSLHMIDKCVGSFWKYIGNLSQQMITLTAGSTQVLQMSDSRKRIESLLDKEGVVCDWHVQQGRLVISAHHSHMQLLEHIFGSETEHTQLVPETTVRQQENKDLQTEDTRVRTADVPQQTDDQHQNKEQQTENVSVQTEEKQTQSGNRSEEKEVQTDENNAKTEEKQTQTSIRHQENKEQQTQDTETQTEAQTPINHLEHRERTDRNRKSADNKQSRGLSTGSTQPTEGTEEENKDTPSHMKEHQTEEERAEDTETQAKWKHQQTKVEGGHIDDHPSHEEAQHVRSRLSPTETVQQVPHELTGHNLDLEESAVSPAEDAEVVEDHPESEDILEEDQSLTCLKSHHSSQGGTENQLMQSSTQGGTSPHSQLLLSRQDDQGMSGHLTLELQSRTVSPVSPPGAQTLEMSNVLVTSVPRPPHNTSPRLFVGLPASQMNNTVPAARSTEPAETFGIPHQTNQRLHAELRETVQSAGMNQPDSRPSAEIGTDPACCGQNQRGCRGRGRMGTQSACSVGTRHRQQTRFTTHHSSHQMHTAATSTTTSNSNNDNISNQLLFQLNSYVLARLSQLENRMSQTTDWEHVHERLFQMETQNENMMQQVIQGLDNLRQGPNDTDSDAMAVCNPSDTQSTLSTSSSSVSGQQQQQQEQQQQEQRRAQQQEQEQHQLNANNTNMLCIVIVALHLLYFAFMSLTRN